MPISHETVLKHEDIGLIQRELSIFVTSSYQYRKTEHTAKAQISLKLQVSIQNMHILPQFEFNTHLPTNKQTHTGHTESTTSR